MKTNSLLLLVSLAVLANRTRAAPSQAEAAVVVLPTYVVNAPLHLPAEQKINASLNELRQQAHAPACCTTGLPLLKLPEMRPDLPKLAAPDAKTFRVAKL